MPLLRRKPNIEKLKAARDVSGLNAALRGGDLEVRRAAAQALADLREPEAMDKLIHNPLSFDELSGPLRSMLDNPACLAHLRTKVMSSEILPSRRELVDMLLPIIPDDVRFLAALAHGSDDQIRARAVDALLPLIPDDVELLLKLAANENDDIRARAAATLAASLHDPRSIEILLEVAVESMKVAWIDSFESLVDAAVEAMKHADESALRSLAPEARQRIVDRLLRTLRSEANRLWAPAALLRSVDPSALEALAEEVRRGTTELPYRVNLAGVLLSSEERDRIAQEQVAKWEGERAAELKRLKTQPPAPSADRTIQAILVLSSEEIPAVRDLLQQIVEQQQGRGHSFAPGFLAAARATSTPADPAYAYAAIRTEFPDLDPDDLADRTERFDFRSLEGMEGHYYIVFDRPA